MEQVSTNKDWVKIFEDEKFRISCNYYPAGYMAISELRTYLERNDSVPKALYDKTMENFSGGYYFRLTVSRKDSTDVLMNRISSQAQYSAITNELTYNMNKYVYMVTGQNDTIHALSYIYQTSYGLSPNVVFLFAFAKNEISSSNSGKIEFVFQDNIFGTGKIIRFGYSTTDLKEEIPNLSEIH